MSLDKTIKKIKNNRNIQTLKNEINTVSGYKIIIGFTIVMVFVFIAIMAPFITRYDPEERFVEGEDKWLTEPDSTNWLGTTYSGHDLYTRCIYGTRTALTVILVATIIAMSIGVPLGLTSGYLGGKSDRALVLFMDAMYSFPGIVLALMIAAALGGGIYPAAGAVAVVYIPQYFRIIRNHVMSIKEEVFIKAARAIGSPGKDTILKYILPNVSQSIPVILTLNAADGVLTLAGLSFLGFGVDYPAPSWGLDLNRAWGYMTSVSSYPQIWYWSAIPGIFIVTLILGFTLFGEGLNDILNPQLREGKRQ